jgi:hypothetical protein
MRFGRVGAHRHCSAHIGIAPFSADSTLYVRTPESARSPGRLLVRFARRAVSRPRVQFVLAYFVFSRNQRSATLVMQLWL